MKDARQEKIERLNKILRWTRCAIMVADEAWCALVGVEKEMQRRRDALTVPVPADTEPDNA